MTVVNSKEFATNQDKYFDLALDEDVCIQRGDNVFHLIYKHVDGMNNYDYEEILEPDDDFRRAISMDEFRERLIVVLDNLDKKYANKCK